MIELVYLLTFLSISMLFFKIFGFELRISPYKELFFIFSITLNLCFYYSYFPIFSLPDYDSKRIFLVNLLKLYFYGDEAFYLVTLYLIWITVYIYNIYIKKNSDFYYHLIEIYYLTFCAQFWYFMLYISKLSWFYSIIFGLLEFFALKLLFQFKLLYKPYSRSFKFVAGVKILLWLFFPNLAFENVANFVVDILFTFIIKIAVGFFFMFLMVISISNNHINFSKIQTIFILPRSIKGNVRIKSLSLIKKDHLYILFFIPVISILYWMLIYIINGKVTGLAFVLVAIGFSIPSALLMTISFTNLNRSYLPLNLIAHASILILVNEVII